MHTNQLLRALTFPLLLSACSEPPDHDEAVQSVELEAVGACSAITPSRGTDVARSNLRVILDEDVDEIQHVSDEHCQVDESLLAALGYGHRQVRLVNIPEPPAAGETPDAVEPALCTVISVGHHLGADKVVMTRKGKTDRWRDGEIKVNLSTNLENGYVAEVLGSPTEDPGQDDGIGEWRGCSINSAYNPLRVAFTAPHGGPIEEGTAEQIGHLAAGYVSSAFLWSVVGDGGEALARWHIMSGDLAERSFAGMRFLQLNTSINHVVSFHGHGQASCTDVHIGGGISTDHRQNVANAIALLAERDNMTIDTSVATCEDNNGSSTWNFVNRYSDHGRGMQLEQSLALRRDVAKRNTVAKAVAMQATAWSHRNDNVALGSTWSGAEGNTSQIAASWQVPAGVRVRAYNNYGDCDAGDRARVDWFVQSSTDGLTRQGGGILTCNANGQLVSSVTFLDKTPTAPTTYTGIIYGYSKGGDPIRVRLRLDDV